MLSQTPSHESWLLAAASVRQHVIAISLNPRKARECCYWWPVIKSCVSDYMYKLPHPGVHHSEATIEWHHYEVGRGAYHRTHDGEIIETIILYPRFPKDSLNQSIQWCHSSSLCCLTDLLSFLPGQSLQQNGMYNLPTWEWRRSAAAAPLSCTLGSQTAKGIESSMKLQIHFFKQMINCQLARFITFLTWQS